MSASIKESRVCLVCGAPGPVPFIRLGDSAFANAFLRPDQLGDPEIKAPLTVAYCPSCYLAQLTHVVDRVTLFRNYLYFSSTSPQLIDHFNDYAREIVERFPEQSKTVVEIASNDGVLLKPLKDRGSRVLGVEPAENIARAANADGIETVPRFFDASVSREITEQIGRVGIVVANNVLAHVDDQNGFVSSVRDLLSPGGVFICEVQYLGDLIDHGEWDNVYHEHLCYFSLLSLKHLFEKNGLSIFDVKRINTQGGSLRVYATHKRQETPRVSDMLHDERQTRKLDRLSTYLRFSSRPENLRSSLVSLLNRLSDSGKTIAGYGAAAKGNTLLQFCGITANTVDYITDEAPSKQGKYTPGSHIPVVPTGMLKERRPDYILILAWNYAASIVAKEKCFTDGGGRFIIPLGPLANLEGFVS